MTKELPETPKIEHLVGKTFHNVELVDDEKLIFHGDTSYVFHHKQDCCEEVCVIDVSGDLSNLENKEIMMAVEASNRFEQGRDDGETWTFYRFATMDDGVVVTWRGSSNGFYSEDVDLDYYDLKPARDKGTEPREKKMVGDTGENPQSRRAEDDMSPDSKN